MREAIARRRGMRETIELMYVYKHALLHVLLDALHLHAMFRVVLDV